MLITRTRCARATPDTWSSGNCATDIQRAFLEIGAALVALVSGKEHAMTTRTKATTAAPITHPEMTKTAEVEAATIERAPCLCGCGGFPKGKNARFIPGHDARYHAAIKRAEMEEEAGADPETAPTPEPAKRAPRGRTVKGGTPETAGKDGAA